ncbi:MAG: hypothetical protein JWM46_513 [Candidatus Kaiserbacteria bacterium]|nr:hypothetical protein [Candidatus Kaiserbacteria bacterium]
MEPFIDKSGYTPRTAAPQGMGAAEWLSTHIYTSACVGAGILLVLGAIVVKSHVPASATNTLQVWGGGDGTLVNSSSYGEQNPVLTNLSSGGSGGNTAISLTPIPVHTVAVSQNTGDSFDVQAWATSMGVGTQPNASVSGTTTADTSIHASYQFIPQGLISTTSPGRTRSAAQQALYEYGNNAGGYIQTYESGRQNTSSILKDQAVDRQNTQKGRAVKDIGDALKAVGVSLQTMDGVPDAAKTLNQALAAGYIDIGEKLSAVPDAPGDDTFIAAIKAYDTSVETFTKKYVALAQYLSLSGVVFAPGDPGSVFTFSGGGGI